MAYDFLLCSLRSVTSQSSKRTLLRTQPCSFTAHTFQPPPLSALWSAASTPRGECMEHFQYWNEGPKPGYFGVWPRPQLFKKTHLVTLSFHEGWEPLPRKTIYKKRLLAVGVMVQLVKYLHRGHELRSLAPAYKVRHDTCQGAVGHAGDKRIPGAHWPSVNSRFSETLKQDGEQG